jgi:hypothetical protein
LNESDSLELEAIAARWYAREAARVPCQMRLICVPVVSRQHGKPGVTNP